MTVETRAFQVEAALDLRGFVQDRFRRMVRDRRFGVDSPTLLEHLQIFCEGSGVEIMEVTRLVHSGDGALVTLKFQGRYWGHMRVYLYDCGSSV